MPLHLRSAFTGGTARAPVTEPLAAPVAIVLTCGCLPEPERALEQAAGSFLVHQSGGLQLDDSTLGVLEYGRRFLDLRQILVIGHEGCHFQGRCHEPAGVAEDIERLLNDAALEVVALESSDGDLRIVGSVDID